MEKTVAEAFVQNIQHNQTTKVTINGEDCRIDNGIKETVEKLNFKYNIRTSSSCSGILREHYNMENISEEVPYEELKNVYGLPPRGYMLMKSPTLFTDSFMHNFFKDNVEVDTDFYKELTTSLDVLSPKHMKRDIQWKIDIGGSSSVSWQQMHKRDIEYIFELTMQSRRNIVMESDSYQQYDLAIEKAISGLEETFDTVL
jgi:hypothetical protein